MEKSGVNGDVSLTDGVLKMSNASPRGRTRTHNLLKNEILSSFNHPHVTASPCDFLFLQSNLMVYLSTTIDLLNNDSISTCFSNKFILQLQNTWNIALKLNNILFKFFSLLK